MTIIEQTCLWKRNYDPIYIASVNDVQGSIFLNISYSLSINHYLCFESKLFSLIMTDNSNLQLLGYSQFYPTKPGQDSEELDARHVLYFSPNLQGIQGNEHVVRGIRIIFEVNALGNGSIVICDTFPLTYVTTSKICFLIS
jgi:hypothetical protein